VVVQTKGGNSGMAKLKTASTRLINENGHYTTKGSEYDEKIKKSLETVFNEALEEDVDLTDLSYIVNSLSH